MTSPDFGQLGLSEPTFRALAEVGFDEPTPVQQQAIPPALQGRDVIACASTGTGKTAAFVIPMTERLSGRRGIVGLMLAPTRELALQLASHASPFATEHRLSVASLIGGVDIDAQIDILAKSPNLVVATPGRLVDHLKRGTISLDGIEVLVLDEADRMLDMGFKPQLTRIIARLPKKRQTMLFSATMAAEVEDFAKSALRDPMRVDVALSGTTAAGADQVVYEVEKLEKNALLLTLLADVPGARTLVFTRTIRRAEKLMKALQRERFRAVQMHAERSQAQRQYALDGFRSGRYQVLLTTDVTARGIDVPNIEHVVNYDVPFAAEDYVHRIGRTARAQATGRASTFVTKEDSSILAAIEKLTRGVLPRLAVPREDPVFVKALADERARQADPGPQTQKSPDTLPVEAKPLGRHARSHPKKPKP